MYLVFPYIHFDSAHKYMYIFFVIAINVCKSAFLVTLQSFFGGMSQKSGISTDYICPSAITGWEISIFKCNIDKRNYMQVCVYVK